MGMGVEVIGSSARGSVDNHANVTSRGQLETQAETKELQTYISEMDGETYQVQGHSVTLTSATHTVLHLKNDSSTQNAQVVFIEIQGVTLANSNLTSEYFELGFGRTVSSNGTAVIPTNMNRTFGKTASVTATEGAGTTPTMAGTFVPFDRFYPGSANDKKSYNKAGSLILGQDDTMEIRYVGTGTTGVAYARIMFMMVDK